MTIPELDVVTLDLLHSYQEVCRGFVSLFGGFVVKLTGGYVVKFHYLF